MLNCLDRPSLFHSDGRVMSAQLYQKWLPYLPASQTRRTTMGVQGSTHLLRKTIRMRKEERNTSRRRRRLL